MFSVLTPNSAFTTYSFPFLLHSSTSLLRLHSPLLLTLFFSSSPFILSFPTSPSLCLLSTLTFPLSPSHYILFSFLFLFLSCPSSLSYPTQPSSCVQVWWGGRDANTKQFLLPDATPSPHYPTPAWRLSLPSIPLHIFPPPGTSSSFICLYLPVSFLSFLSAFHSSCSLCFLICFHILFLIPPTSVQPVHLSHPFPFPSIIPCRWHFLSP